MKPSEFIIVGSGINALVCAALLAKRGRSVRVLERSDRVGGCIRSEEITEPGFIHDVMAATFVLFTTSPAYAELANDLHARGLKFRDTPLPTGVLLPDGRHAIYRRSTESNAKAFEALAPGDGHRHRADVGEVAANAPLLFALLGGRLWSWGTVGLLVKEGYRRGFRNLVALFGNAMGTARGWLEGGYRSEEVRALWAPWALHTGLGPESAFSAQMGKIIAFALEAAGAPIVEGGAGRFADTMRQVIEDHGGIVQVNTDVAAIIAEGGVARGVETGTGERFMASRAVICSVTPDQLYGRLLKAHEIPEAVQSEAADYRYGKGNMQIHYALDRPPAWPIPELGQVALLHLTPGLDGVSKAANEAERGMLPGEPTICVGHPSALDPSRCPAGKAVLWLQLPETPRRIKGDAAGELMPPADGCWSDTLRERYADRAEAILERHIPGFRETVLRRRVYSPADLEAINVNLVGGDPYGGYCGIDQFFVWRPLKSSINHSTCVPRLYHIGASTHPGPGLGGGSGYLVAKALG